MDFTIERVNLNKLFSVDDAGGDSFVVPSFQRNYVWERENFEEFMEDIESGEVRFLGTLVFCRKGKRIMEVIDGQQRLTTISVAALAASLALRSKDEQAADQIAHGFLLNDNSVKLEHAGSLREFWKPLMQQERFRGRPVFFSDRLRVINALKFFLSRLKEKDAKGIKEFAKKMEQNLIFARVVAASDIVAHTLFETLNGRGKPLSPADLIKSWVISRLPDDEAESIDSRWQEIKRKTGGEREILPFLRMCHNSRATLATAKTLFSKTRKQVGTEEETRGYLSNLEKLAPIYSRLRDPKDDCPHAAALWSLRLLALMRVRLIYPVIFAAYEKGFDSKQLFRLCRMFATLMIRRKFCDKRSGPLEIAANNAALKIMRGDFSDSDIVCRFFRDSEINPKGDDFVTATRFARFPCKTKNDRELIMRLLVGLESGEIQSSEPHNLVEDLKNVHMIQIVSKKELQQGNENPDIADRFGNYALSDEPFAPTKGAVPRGAGGKIEILQKSKFQLTRHTAESFTIHGNWQAKIEKAQYHMAGIAEKVWVCDSDNCPDDTADPDTFGADLRRWLQGNAKIGESVHPEMSALLDAADKLRRAGWFDAF